MDSLDFLINMILLVTALAQFVIAVLSFINGGLARKTIVAAIVMICGAAWTVILLSATYIANDNNLALLNQLVVVIAVILFYFVALLGLSFLDLKAKLFYLLGALLTIPGICMSLAAFFAFDLFFLELWMLDNGSVHLKINPPAVMLFVVLIIAYVGTAIAALLIARKRAQSKLGKKLIRNVIIGVILGFLSPMIFNVANAEVHELHVLGPFGLLAMAFFTYSAFVKHGDDSL